jgi:hypothetical protein
MLQEIHLRTLNLSKYYKQIKAIDNLSPVHAVSALKKVVFMQMGFMDIVAELISLISLTIFYFSLGIWAFEYRHLGRR